jgi:hypothetical protein
MSVAGGVRGQAKQKEIKKYTTEASMCMKTNKTGGKMSAYFAQLLCMLRVFPVILAKLERNCEVLKLNLVDLTSNRIGIEYSAL